MLKRRAELRPVPHFHFANSREVELTLVALQRLSDSGDVDPIEQDTFEAFLNAFKTYSLTI